MDPIAPRQDLLVQASKAGDLDALVSLFCEDAVLMASNEPTLYGRAEVREWYQEYFENFRIAVLAVTEREVTVLGDWAVERASYSIVINPVKAGERIRDDTMNSLHQPLPGVPGWPNGDRSNLAPKEIERAGGCTIFRLVRALAWVIAI